MLIFGMCIGLNRCVPFSHPARRFARFVHAQVCGNFLWILSISFDFMVPGGPGKQGVEYPGQSSPAPVSGQESLIQRDGTTLSKCFFCPHKGCINTQLSFDTWGLQTAPGPILQSGSQRQTNSTKPFIHFHLA